MVRRGSFFEFNGCLHSSPKCYGGTHFVRHGGLREIFYHLALPPSPGGYGGQVVQGGTLYEIANLDIRI